MADDIVRPRRLYKQVAEKIEAMVADGSLAVGAQIPSEVELARRFGVSRPTIREAMIVLEASGVVEVRNGSGTFALAPTERPRKTPVAADPGPGPYEQFEARELIECEVAARAATRISAEAIGELEAIIAQMEVNYPREPVQDSEGFRFHVVLARASENSIFARMIEELWHLRGGAMWSTIRSRILQPGHRYEAIQSRKEIVQALKARDAEAARAAMRRMLIRARKIYFDELR